MTETCNRRASRRHVLAGVLGPTMIVSDGEKVRFDITNNLADETTDPWHGLHIAPSAGGGPQNVIESGATWSPETTINQGEARTLWYHPHGLGTTAEQVSHGLAGMLIVDAGSAGNQALPHDYGAGDQERGQCRPVAWVGISASRRRWRRGRADPRPCG